MSLELVQAVQVLMQEKGYDSTIIYEALEAALLQAYRKEFDANPNAYASINRENGEYKVFVNKTVVDEVVNNSIEISLDDARKINKLLSVGDMVTVDVTPNNFGRSAALMAKQILIQRLREAERNNIFSAYAGHEGQMVTGEITRIDGKNVFVSLGNADAMLPPSEQIPDEEYYVGKKMKLYMVEVKKMAKGPQIMVSRTHPGLLKRLLEFEVPELVEGVIELKAVTREPGMRSKISVVSRDPNVDPVGACVGPQGQRVQNIVNELCDEKIDVVRWDENPGQYIANALSPAQVISVDINEEEQASRVVVPDHQLSLAIGKAGQNARLAAKLTNWKIDIKSESQSEVESF